VSPDSQQRVAAAQLLVRKTQLGPTLARVERRGGPIYTLCDFSGEIIRSRRQLETLSVSVRDEGGPVLSAEISFQKIYGRTDVRPRRSADSLVAFLATGWAIGPKKKPRPMKRRRGFEQFRRKAAAPRLSTQLGGGIKRIGALQKSQQGTRANPLRPRRSSGYKEKPRPTLRYGALVSCPIPLAPAARLGASKGRWLKKLAQSRTAVALNHA
jgi:hypothetical protein